ncbi:galactose-binding domain-like protein [Sporodiniella umbellata]|nr:galactose-binding domain-like protein [Sporodiniella umbellata]
MGNGLSRSSYVEISYEDAQKANLDDYAQLTCITRDSYIDYVSDEYYGKAENMLKPEEVDISLSAHQEGTTDGWQVRRHQSTASAIICLGCKGTIDGFDIETSGFMESAPSNVLVEGYMENEMDGGKWVTLLPNVPVQMNAHNFFKIEHDSHIYSKLKLTTAPGGGIARFRCYGQVAFAWKDLKHEYNLASANLGAQIVRWTDVDYLNKPNILLDHGVSQSSGWLTPRSHGEARNDSVVIQLATPGILSAVALDTSGFEGNIPKRFAVEGCYTLEVDPHVDLNAKWFPLVSKTECLPNIEHMYSVVYGLPVSHIRLNLYPDGGIQQIKVLGIPSMEEPPVVSNGIQTREESMEQEAENELNERITQDIKSLVLPKVTTVYKSTHIVTKKRKIMEIKKAPASEDSPKQLEYKTKLRRTTRTSANVPL